MLARNLRPHDVLGRVGGEEFAVFLHCSDQEALAIAERMRQDAQLQRVEQIPQLRYTISIGSVTVVPKDVTDLEQMPTYTVQKMADATKWSAHDIDGAVNRHAIGS